MDQFALLPCAEHLCPVQALQNSVRFLSGLWIHKMDMLEYGQLPFLPCCDSQPFFAA